MPIYIIVREFIRKENNMSNVNEIASAFDYCDPIDEQDADVLDNESIDYHDEATYEDYEPNPYDGTYSEM